MNDSPARVRGEVAAALPSLIRRTLSAYRAFAEDGADMPPAGKEAAPPEAKDFAARQAACKTAAGHLELLLRLLRTVAADNGDAGAASSDEDPGANDLDDLVQAARTAVRETSGQP